MSANQILPTCRSMHTNIFYAYAQKILYAVLYKHKKNFLCLQNINFIQIKINNNL